MQDKHITPTMIARICQMCGKAFHCYPSHLKHSPKKYCSAACYNATRDNHEVRLCACCAKPFRLIRSEILRGHGHYCSHKCSGREKLSTETRFWKYVTKTDSCWLWTGVKNQRGYGLVRINLPTGRATSRTASRVSWELHVGPIPDGLYVLHNCPGGDNPSCVNPAHLWLGTKADNNADCIAKGRNARGERNGSARLTAPEVLEIRKLYAAGQATRPELMAEFHVGQGTIQAIVEGRTWKHLLDQ